MPESSGGPGLVPQPERVQPRAGWWVLSCATRTAGSGAAHSEASRLADALSGALGCRLGTAGEARAGDIAMTLDASRTDLGDEGYELRVSPAGVRMTARRPAGLFYAGVTLRQLLPAAIWRRAPAGATVWKAPAVRIVDRPRFPWRGLLLDPARHFLPKAAVLEFLDLMALHKLNRLQLHLTDDQGWRIELRGFPKLTARSSWRDGTLIGRMRDGPQRYSKVPHGGFYSQDDVREIVSYAQARHIVVVPEIEMPGHTRALLAAYPELGVFPEQLTGIGLLQRWGIAKEILAPRPATLAACRRLLDEICELFPSPWIHTGGDEAPRDQWRESAEMQRSMRSLGLKTEDALQAWFTGEMSRHLAAKGRKLVGWDEILAGAEAGGRAALDPGAVVMSWRGAEGGRAAVLAGRQAVMAPHQWTYLDYYQGPPAEEPLAIGGSLSLARAYAFEPIPDGLPQEAARRILGGQAQLWSEYLPSSDAVAYMALPRLAALAEVFWSAREGRDFGEFLARLEEHESRLRAAGVPYRALARRTCLPLPNGRIAAEPGDAVIHGTDMARGSDGSLDGWRDPFTFVAWRLEVPEARAYRVRVEVARTAIQPGSWLEAVIAGARLRGEPGKAERVDLGVFHAAAGPHLLFLRAGGQPGPEGYAVVRGVEITPAGP